MGEIDFIKASLIVSAVASLATLVTMVLVALTLREMAKQRKTTYRPDIVLSTSGYFIYAEHQDGALSYFHFSNEEVEPNSVQIERRLNRVYLDGFDIGLGTAKLVDVAWEFQVDHLVQKLNEDVASGFQVEFKHDDVFTEGYLSYKLPKEPSGGVIALSHDIHRTYDHLLPIHVKDEPTKISMPFTYLLITAARLYSTMVDKTKRAAEDFSVLRVKITYADIGNNLHKKSFSVTPSLVSWQMPPAPRNLQKGFIQVSIAEDK